MSNFFGVTGFLIYIYVFMFLGAWVFIDSYKRTGKFLISYVWQIAVTILPFPLVIVYLLTRPKTFGTQPLLPKTCPYCKKEYWTEIEFCPNCNHYLDQNIVAQNHKT